ncbi:MAG: EcsC family protein [Acidobacteriota bacterium]|nr:EcsC family protein [Acidobacteriota bacterium]
MADKSILVDAFTRMARFDSSGAKTELMVEASKHSLEEWKNLNRAKTGGAGFATGVLGGPWALAAEGADLAYLLRTAARAAIGVGHVLGEEVEHEEDMYAILAIWSGAAEASQHVVAGKFVVKVGGKVGMQYAAATTATILAKSALKGNSKLAVKITSKAAAKLGAKLAAKVSTKWIPVFGGVASAAVNLWVMNGILDAAYGRYTNPYIIFDEDPES